MRALITTRRLITRNLFLNARSASSGRHWLTARRAAIVASAVLLAYACVPATISSDSIAKPFSTAAESATSTGNGNKQTITLLPDAEVTARLRSLEESYTVQRGKGIVRYDVSQLPSNNPIEDDRIEQVVTVPNGASSEDLYFWGIFDGHSGYHTSLKLREELVNYVCHQLSGIYGAGELSNLDQDAIDCAIKEGFKQLDYDIVNKSLDSLFQDPSRDNMQNILSAISGSCALLSMYDSSSGLLKVAVTGDSRALLGSWDTSAQKWTVTAMSQDQTADEPSEVERIRSEHPDEPHVVSRGRVLGSLQPSRAFGDYRYKVGEINGKSVETLPEHLRAYFRRYPNNFLTPPYVTAEPVVTTFKPQNNDFMVMASDGLYELLSNEEIVGLVGAWLDRAKKPTAIPAVENKSTCEQPRLPFRRSGKNGLLLEDENVATHLVRNALSAGGDPNYVSTLVSIPSPMSRRYRDDLTVTVVFFGEGKDDGKIEVNHAATAGGLPKPKL